MKYFRLVLVFSLYCIFNKGFSQDTLVHFSFNDKFNDANLLMEEKLYPIALPVWLEVLQTDTGNSNWNYKVGICYLNSSNERTRSLSYLEKAILNTSKNYNPFSSSEKRSPNDAYYYLAKSYHLNNQIDKAIEYFNKFKDVAGKKHYMIPDVERSLEMCLNAKDMLGKPITVKITNLGDKINSPSPEYGAVLSLDEKALYFTSRRLWKDSSNSDMKERSDGDYFEDIYVSFKGSDGNWLEPELLNFNRPDDHEATISLSADGHTLYLYRDEDGNGNLYQSFFIDTSWSGPVPMGSDINSKSHETHLTVTMDGKTLYFVSNRKGGFGEKDIYKCTKLPNGQWSLAQNLGPIINSKFDEDGPFIHPDGKTMFFSSKGHKSMGGFDIFMTTLKDDGTWSEPENLGYPINTTDDDIFFVLSPDGKRAYYSSFREGGHGSKDIYIIQQPDAIEHSLTLIKGTITVPEGMEIPDDLNIVITNNETGEYVTEVKPLKRNGSFVFIIPPGKNYNISYNIGETEFYNENVYVPVGKDYNEVDKLIALNPQKLGTPEAVKVDIISSREKPKPQWQIRFREPGKMIPDSSYIQYLNAEGAVIYEELISKSGFFNYYELEKTQPYLFTLKSKDSPLCSQAEIVLINGEKDARYLADEKCIFKEEEIINPKFIFNSLGFTIPDNVSLQYLDNNENVLFEEVLKKSGDLVFHQMPSDSSYILRVGLDASFCKEAKIEIPKKDGGSLTLLPDAKCIFRLREQKPKFLFSSLEKEFSAGLGVQYLDEKGKIIYEEKINEKGEFNFHVLPIEKPYLMKLKTKNTSFCDEGEITIPGPGGSVYTLIADENCIFRVKDKKSKFVYEYLDKETAGGLRIQIIDENGNVVLEEKMNEKGEFPYYKFPTDKKYSIKILPYSPEKFRNTEIIIPSLGKKFFKYVPDESGVFRLKDVKEETIVAGEEKSIMPEKVIEVNEKEPVIENEKTVVKEKEKTVTQSPVAIAKTILFDYNSFEIGSQYLQELDEVVKTLKEYSSMKVEIFGHTDSKGTDDFNQNLSKKRAENSAKYLISKGISRKRITTKGFGESQPVAPNILPDGSDNPEGRQKNRRIELKGKN